MQLLQFWIIRSHNKFEYRLATKLLFLDHFLKAFHMEPSLQGFCITISFTMVNRSSETNFFSFTVLKLFKKTYLYLYIYWETDRQTGKQREREMEREGEKRDETDFETEKQRTTDREKERKERIVSIYVKNMHIWICIFVKYLRTYRHTSRHICLSVYIFICRCVCTCVCECVCVMSCGRKTKYTCGGINVWVYLQI